ncbi:FAD synthetase 2, chloroplastic-like isoform X2 [Humulus lupulus]|uniref:FAD synthetase 2, chloroplastic-like isoform X2 n=1 Tax=Humulus lupulus TaxID=3486 RepID=UPI002B40CF86|nr:FAD synthetase 2, chloroplastic-like isoform X2 [Humulus lupulus]
MPNNQVRQSGFLAKPIFGSIQPLPSCSTAMLASGGGGGCSRVSLHLRECDLSFGFYSSTIAHRLSRSSPLNTFRKRIQQRMISSSLIYSKSPSEVPLLSTCFSQQEVDRGEVPSEGLSSVAGGVVALGKFDALHIGQRELAVQASKVGTPFLLSFVGMAEVLGWESRPPVVAKCDRKRVFSSWSPYCGNVAPMEFGIEFSSVRHLSPKAFVEKLAKDLGVRGVVAGENYRFGYKAAGDAAELVKLCEEYGMGAYIINPVMDNNQLFVNINSGNPNDRGQVSSTRVRRALAVGDMKYVSELLGRRHRLILKANNREVFTCNKHKLSTPKSCLLNLAPKEGLYENCYLIVGEKLIPCRVVIDTAQIHIEMDDIGTSSYFGSEDLELLRIEFGNSQS